MHAFRVTITNRRGMIGETVRRMYDANTPEEAKKQAYSTHPYRYGWRVKTVEKYV